MYCYRQLVQFLICLKIMKIEDVSLRTPLEIYNELSFLRKLEYKCKDEI